MNVTGFNKVWKNRNFMEAFRREKGIFGISETPGRCGGFKYGSDDGNLGCGKPGSFVGRNLKGITMSILVDYNGYGCHRSRIVEMSGQTGLS